MRITTLIENTARADCFKAEHGISLLIETDVCRILFDCGQSGAFADNAKRLGIDLKDVDAVVLSHGHYDHGGGLARFFSVNRTAPVYVSRHAFEPHYHGKDRYIGLDVSLMDSGRFCFAETAQRIADGVMLYGADGKEPVCPVDSCGLSVLKNGFLLAEDFCHEQYLIVEEQGKRVLFSGCSHKGLLNIMRWFTPDVFVGGFHLKDIIPDDAGRRRLSRTAQALLEYGAVYYTGHCTGDVQYRYLKERMGDSLHYLSSGTIVEVPGTDTVPREDRHGNKSTAV